MAEEPTNNKDSKASRFRSPVTNKGYRAGLPSPNKGRSFPQMPVSSSEVDALLAAANDGKTGKRLRAIIAVIYGASLKVGEVTDLDTRHYDRASGVLTVPARGMRKERRVSLDDWTREHLDPWLEERRKALVRPSYMTPLFCTVAADHLGYRVTTAQIRNSIRNVATKAGIEKRVNPEALAKSRQLRMDKTSILAKHFIEYLDDDRFRARYPAAFACWESALDLVGLPVARHAYEIGDHCRNALVEFARGLCARYGITEPPKGTHAMIDAVLDKGKPSSESTVKVLKALTTYWEAVSKYSARESHARDRDAAKIAAEDGRRLVFQTMMVMFEIDRGMDQLVPLPDERPWRRAA